MHRLERLNYLGSVLKENGNSTREITALIYVELACICVYYGVVFGKHPPLTLQLRYT